MRLLKTLCIGIVFILGLVAGQYLARAYPAGEWTDTPESALLPYNPFQTVAAQASPQDRITERQIGVYADRVVLDIKNAQWARFTDTKSMEPVIVAGSNAIELTPESENDIKVGDIVSYTSEYAEGYIIHRVVFKGRDEQGTYFILKGDNLPASDPGRVRFDQIKSVVVAIIY